MFIFNKEIRICEDYPVELNKWVNIFITQKLVNGKVINKNFEFKQIKTFPVYV